MREEIPFTKVTYLFGSMPSEAMQLEASMPGKKCHYFLINGFTLEISCGDKKIYKTIPGIKSTQRERIKEKETERKEAHLKNIRRQLEEIEQAERERRAEMREWERREAIRYQLEAEKRQKAERKERERLKQFVDGIAQKPRKIQQFELTREQKREWWYFLQKNYPQNYRAANWYYENREELMSSIGYGPDAISVNDYFQFRGLPKIYTDQDGNIQVEK